MHWIVIPFRGPEAAKSRLAGALSDTSRRELALAMFRHVLEVAVACVGRERVLVVTPCAGTATAASAAGVTAFVETAGSLNGALALAREELRRKGASHATILAADLPLLTAADVAAAMAAGKDEIAIAPDRSGHGTNALTLPLEADLTFSFGPGSLEAHRREAGRLGRALTEVARPGLASDIDVEADLALIGGGAWPGASATRRGAA